MGCACRGRGSSGCACVLEAGDNILISGAGKSSDPFVISSDPEVSDTTVQVSDTATLDLTITGDGNAGTPYVISGVVLVPGKLTVSDTATLDLTLTGTGTVADPYVVSGTVLVPGKLTVSDSTRLDLTLTGSGTVADPYVLSGEVAATGLVNVADTATIDMSRSGSGTAADPYIVSGACLVPGKLTINDTTTVDLTLSGSGTVADPYVLSAASLLSVVTDPAGPYPVGLQREVLSGATLTVSEAALRHNVAYSIPKWGSTTPDRLGAADPSGTPSGASASYATTSKWTRSRRVDYTQSSAAGAVAGVRWSGAQVIRGSSAGEGGFYLKQSFSPVSAGTSTTTHRLFAGLTSATGAPTDIDPSTQTDVIGMGYDDDDTNVQIMHNDGSGSCTKVDLGSNFVVPTTDSAALYSLELWCPGGGSDVFYRATNVITGDTASGTLSSNLPSATTVLIVRGYISTGGATAAATFGHHGWIESTPEVLA